MVRFIDKFTVQFIVDTKRRCERVLRSPDDPTPPLVLYVELSENGDFFYFPFIYLPSKNILTV